MTCRGRSRNCAVRYTSSPGPGTSSVSAGAALRRGHADLLTATAVGREIGGSDAELADLSVGGAQRGDS